MDKSIVSKSPTRADYLAGVVDHQTFYRAVVATAGVRVTDRALLERVREALRGGDQHLNSIPLGLWDNRANGARGALSRALKEHGDFYSLAGGVCCMKQAARDAALAAPSEDY